MERGSKMKEDKNRFDKESKLKILLQLKKNFELTFEDIAYLLGVSQEALECWNTDFYSLFKHKIMISDISQTDNGLQRNFIKENRELHNTINDLKEATCKDKITGIYNKDGCIQALSEILLSKQEKKYAMIYIYIKNLKFILNLEEELYSHKVITHLVQHLKAECREGEFCARLEKDIFLLVFAYEEKEELDKRLQDMIESISNKSFLVCNMSKLYFEFGIYMVDNKADEKPIKMIEKAALATNYNGIVRMGNRIEYYQSWMRDQQAYQYDLLKKAPDALKNNEFELYIQPQFDLCTFTLAAGEALVRWVPCKQTCIPPDDFIPLFEESGLISTFDLYMLKKLCMKLREWMNLNIKIKPISINQSQIHIEDANYMKKFCSIVDQFEIPHSLIIFELTETMFVALGEKMIHFAKALQRKGFLLAIDDFGTGYASLNLLSRVNADILKIDKELLFGIEDKLQIRIILQYVIEMAHKMKMTVICEGIETQCQLQHLKQLGCDIGQGYLMGYPVHADEFQCMWMREDIMMFDGAI